MKNFETLRERKSVKIRLFTFTPSCYSGFFLQRESYLLYLEFSLRTSDSVSYAKDMFLYPARESQVQHPCRESERHLRIISDSTSARLA
jgi:hypothetical protein